MIPDKFNRWTHLHMREPMHMHRKAVVTAMLITTRRLDKKEKMVVTSIFCPFHGLFSKASFHWDEKTLDGMCKVNTLSQTAHFVSDLNSYQQPRKLL